MKGQIRGLCIFFLFFINMNFKQKLLYVKYVFSNLLYWQTCLINVNRHSSLVASNNNRVLHEVRQSPPSKLNENIMSNHQFDKYLPTSSLASQFTLNMRPQKMKKKKAEMLYEIILLFKNRQIKGSNLRGNLLYWNKQCPVLHINSLIFNSLTLLH